MKQTTTTDTIVKEWEKEFDREFPGLYVKTSGKPYSPDGGKILTNTYEEFATFRVKQFIKSKISKTREESYKQGFEQGKTYAHDGLRVAFTNLQTPTILYVKDKKLMQLDLVKFFEDLASLKEKQIKV